MLVHEASNLTTDQFAKSLGIGASQLSHYKKRRNIPSHEVLFNAAERYGVSVDWLYFGYQRRHFNQVMVTRIKELSSESDEPAEPA
jgi:transcriptional regulator with XRE-family HTH domain